jgi:hypothetical protein
MFYLLDTPVKGDFEHVVLCLPRCLPADHAVALLKSISEHMQTTIFGYFKDGEVRELLQIAFSSSEVHSNPKKARSLFNTAVKKVVGRNNSDVLDCLLVSSPR